MSQNPNRLAKPPSEYNEDFFVALNNAFKNNLKVIDNVILNKLANQNMASDENNGK